MLAGAAISKQLGEVVSIIGAGAYVWIVLIHVGLHCPLQSKLSSCVVKSSKDVPSIFKAWSKHASEWVDCHNLECRETGSHGHDNEFNHELSVRGDFSEESLPSSITHCHCLADAGWDYFLPAVESNIVHMSDLILL